MTRFEVVSPRGNRTVIRDQETGRSIQVRLCDLRGIKAALRELFEEEDGARNHALETIQNADQKINDEVMRDVVYTAVDQSRGRWAGLKINPPQMTRSGESLNWKIEQVMEDAPPFHLATIHRMAAPLFCDMADHGDRVPAAKGCAPLEAYQYTVTVMDYMDIRITPTRDFVISDYESENDAWKAAVQHCEEQAEQHRRHIELVKKRTNLAQF
jgi:hypothetical protein